MDADRVESNERLDAGAYDDEIRFGSTGLRALLTVLFALIWGVLETLMGLIVVFSLIWTGLTQQAPPERLRGFANTLLTYSYRIWRYVTYNEAEVPFPFNDFPEPLEPPRELGTDSAREVRGLVDRD